MISLDEEIKKDREGNKANRRRYVFVFSMCR